MAASYLKYTLDPGTTDTNQYVRSSAADPWHFDTDPDRGSMLLTNGSGSESWIRILLISSLTFKMPTTRYRTFTSFFKDIKSKRSHKTVGIKFLRTIFAWWSKEPDPDPYLWLTDPDPDLGGPKTYGSWSATLVSRCFKTSLNYSSFSLFRC